MKQPFEQEPKIAAWKERTLDSGCRVDSIKEISSIYKKNDSLLFSLLDTTVTAPEGYRLPHIALIRGDASVVVPMVRNQANGQQLFLMVKQRRIANGGLSLEFPAGMLDDDTNDPVTVAIRELHEETGLHIDKKDLFPLADKPLYSSAGLQDEAVYFFGCRIVMSEKEYNGFENRIISNKPDNEHIIVTLKTFEDGFSETNSLQARLGFLLFREYYNKVKS